MNDDQLGVLSERFEQLEIHLTRIERLLSIAFTEQVKAKRQGHEIDDEVVAEILLRTSTWTAAGPLRRDVRTATRAADRTVKRRLSKLVELGALEHRGKTASSEYRSTGRFG